jgi:hypothetical protein
MCVARTKRCANHAQSEKTEKFVSLALEPVHSHASEIHSRAHCACVRVFACSRADNRPVSTLSAQLAALSHRPTQSDGVRRARVPSLLFDNKHAETISLSTIYNLGVNGYQELKKLDSRFIQFEDSIFGKTISETNREQQTKVGPLFSLCFFAFSSQRVTARRSNALTQ